MMGKLAFLLLISTASFFAFIGYKISQYPIKDSIEEKNRVRLLKAIVTGCPYLAIFGINAYRKCLNFFAHVDQIVGGRVPEVRVKKTTIAGVSVWIYEHGFTVESTDRSALIYLHGGGWVVGSPMTVDNWAKIICKNTRFVIFNVDYRLAPEYRFPAAFDDAYGVTKYVTDNPAEFGLNPKKIAIAGDSAGGNLAAAVALHLKSKLRAQFLIYAGFQALNFQTSSMLLNNTLILDREHCATAATVYGEFGMENIDVLLKNEHIDKSIDEKLLSRADLLTVQREMPKEWQEVITQTETYPRVRSLLKMPRVSNDFTRKILPTLTDPRFSPLMASDEMIKGSPMAYFVVAADDVLRDGSFLYAQRLRKAGVRVELKYYKDAFHGFFCILNLSLSSKANADFGNFIYTDIIHK